MAESRTLEKIVNGLKGCLLNTKICKEITKALDHGNDVKPQLIHKLLEVCIQHSKDDLKQATEILNIVSIILKKVTAREFIKKPDLMPSLLAILGIVNNGYDSTSDEIKNLYFNILLEYPDDVYLQLKKPSEIMKMINLYVNLQVPIKLRKQVIYVLHKYVKVLPPDKRLEFVKQGINAWLLKLLPCVMLFAKTPDIDVEIPVAALEIVVEQFQYFDYFDNPNWPTTLQSIYYDPQKYLFTIKTLLSGGNYIWHRLWILLIKLLKNQLTKSTSYGSPINSMLPSVEMAFKLDARNRCYAFQCWNALIDNFASETNESHLNKRIKLLVIPLLANNAKVEETIMAKIDTWWHLICTYSSRYSYFSNVILLPFLQFCFGLPSQKTQPLGALTDKSKEYCVEAFVGIFGHYKCDGCVSLAAAKEKIIDEECLIDCKEELVHSMKAAIKIVSNNATFLRMKYKCAWMSFIKLICDMSRTDTKRSLFMELLVMLENLVEDSQNEVLADIIMNDVLLTLFEGDNQIVQLLYRMHVDSPTHKLLLIILNQSFNSIFNENNMTMTHEKFKPFTNFIINHSHRTSLIEALLNRLTDNYKSVTLWIALVSSIWEKKWQIEEKNLHKTLLWALDNLDVFTKVEVSTTLWLQLFEFVTTEPGNSCFEDEISEVIDDPGNITETNSSLFLNISIILLKQKLASHKKIDYEKEVRIVYDILNKNRYLHHADFSKVIDTLLKVFEKHLKDVNIKIIKRALMILKIVFAVLAKEVEKSSKIDEPILLQVNNLLKSVEAILKQDDYESVKEIVLSQLLEYGQLFGQQESLKDTVITILQMFLITSSTNNSFVDKIKSIIDTIKKDSNSATPIDKSKFTTPSTKKAKKKGASIVNTVVEDGEEFVVVKSNWKFNPKKLTDNQKEKLKRKREDIPALYQDLSQSQDEFKLNTWKTGSQDTTTTTSSKSNDLTTSEKVSSLLKNIPNSDVVPKILKNILPENNEEKNPILEPSNEHNNETRTPVNKKHTPRLSLKDRVFRNVKILCEKFDVTSAEPPKPIEDIAARSQTPAGMSIKIPDVILNSAPSDLNADRPSRLKRKPKKFEEMPIFGIKKRRHSLQSGESQNKDSCENLSQSHNDSHSEGKGIIQNLTNTVAENKKNPNNLAPSLDGGVLFCNEAQNKNIFNIDHDKSTRDNTDNHQESTAVKAVIVNSTIDNTIVVDNSTVAVEGNITNNNKRQITEKNSINTPSIKKVGKRRSQLEKVLAIDMVEGNPFLNVQSEKRLTRKQLSNSPVVPRKKSLPQKSKTVQKQQVDKKVKQIDKQLEKSEDLNPSRESQNSSLQDDNGSQDIIESSQDSTVSIMSVKSSKTKKIPVVTLEKFEYKMLINKSDESDKLFSLGSKTKNEPITLKCKNKDDSEFHNKMDIEHAKTDLTEDMDTEHVEDISCKNDGYKSLTNNMAVETDEGNNNNNDANESPLNKTSKEPVEIDLTDNWETKPTKNNNDSEYPINETVTGHGKINFTDNLDMETMETSNCKTSFGNELALNKTVNEPAEIDFTDNLDTDPIKNADCKKEYNTELPCNETAMEHCEIKITDSKSSDINELPLNQIVREGSPNREAEINLTNNLDTDPTKSVDCKIMDDSEFSVNNPPIEREINLTDTLDTEPIKIIDFENSDNKLPLNAIAKEPALINITSNSDMDPIRSIDCKINDDSEFPLNETAIEHNEINLTDNLDTEPMENINCENCGDKELSLNQIAREPPDIDLRNNLDTDLIKSIHCKNNDDSDFPVNKTATELVEIDSTKNIDIKPIGNISSDEVIVINVEDEPTITNNLEDTCVDMDTQDLANADTQPVNSNSITSLAAKNSITEDITKGLDIGELQDVPKNCTSEDVTKSLDADDLQDHAIDSISNIEKSTIQTQDESTRSLTESLLCTTEKKQDKSLTRLSAEDEEQRKQDFLNNTSEISPIKLLSPVRENKSSSLETSSDYDVIQLSSPVQNNGEPFEKCDSPEIFTEEKLSPDTRDQSPPREVNRVGTASPRSLSLKKNKPKVRSGGRAAQMLGLCVSVQDRLQSILNSKKSPEPKHTSQFNSTARRNLRILYNLSNESNDATEESEENQGFLKIKKSSPNADSSPSVPILKRKLGDIVDDTTVSPASKRKRVSFHDPPVSTTISVKKYIDPQSLRSPQNSATKRQGRRTRTQVGAKFKSQKRLDTVFKLETALTKAVESFNEDETTPNATENTEMSSLEPTPLVEVVKNSELNDVDPICLDLINCKDPIDNIAGDLSSPAMKPLLIKEFAGKLQTVGDLAKMTELEVNRLCIKAPKVQIAKKVLTKYAEKMNTVAIEMISMTESAFSESSVEAKIVDVEIQTDSVVIESMATQTEELATSVACTQTNTVCTMGKDVQTDESGDKSEDMSFLEKPDLCKHLNKLLDMPSKQSIASSLPLSVLTDTVLQEMDLKSSNELMDRLLEKHATDSQNGSNDNKRLSFMRDYLSKRFCSKDLILLCTELLNKVHDNI